MKPLLLISLIMSSAFIPVSQSGLRKKPSVITEQNVVEVNRAWVEAFSHCDVSTLNQIVADDCMITTEHGDLASKPEFVKLVQSQGAENCRSEGLAITDVKVQTFGPASIITGLMSKTQKGKRLRLRYTNVYVRRNGRWELVTSQATHVMAVSLEIEPLKPPK